MDGLYKKTHFNIGNRTIGSLRLTHMASVSKSFDFNLRRIIKKISYERRDYESVDEKSLSSAMSRKSTKKRIQAVKG